MNWPFLWLLAIPAGGEAMLRTPPVLNEGWVFSTESTQRASAVCPVIGRVTAEAHAGRRGNTFQINGIGRSSGAADKRMIDNILRPLSSVDHIQIGCWGHKGALIAVFGPPIKSERIDFLWTSTGLTPLSADSVYPSVVGRSK